MLPLQKKNYNIFMKIVFDVLVNKKKINKLLKNPVLGTVLQSRIETTAESNLDSAKIFDNISNI